MEALHWQKSSFRHPYSLSFTIYTSYLMLCGETFTCRRERKGDGRSWMDEVCNLSAISFLYILVNAMQNLKRKKKMKMEGLGQIRSAI